MRSISAVVVVVIRAIRFCRRLVRRVERVLRADHARIELDEIDDALARALGRIQVFRVGAARDAQEPAHCARLLERVEQRDLAGGEIAGPCMLQPKRGERIEAAGLALRVIQDLLLDLAERHPRLRGRVRRLHTVDDVERCETELAERQRARFDDRPCHVVEPLDRCSGSCCRRRAA